MRSLSLLTVALLLLARVPLAAEPKLHRIDPQTPEGLRQIFRHSDERLPFVSAHRGGAWEGYPENCIPTFEHTLASTYSILEIDPRYTKDGQIVVLHDPTLDRTTTGRGKLVDFTVDEVKKLRLKDLRGNPTDYQIPTLDEVIEWAKGRTVLVLDQKDVAALDRVKAIEKHHAEAYVMLIVNSFKDIQAVYKQNPHVMMEVMIPNREKVAEFDRLGVPWANVIPFIGHDPPTDLELYKEIHARGANCMIGTSRNLDRKIITRQVSDIETLRADYDVFLGRGADLIETDIPVHLGPMLYSKTPVPASLKAYFRVE